MKNFSIPSPCSENWNEMSKTEKGAFCQKCAHEVNDVTTFSNTQIRELFRANNGKRTCVRMTFDQEQSLHTDFEVWNVSNKKHMQRAMMFSLLVVFGLTLFSCTNPTQAQELDSIRSNVQTLIDSKQQDENDVPKEIHMLGELAVIDDREIEQPVEPEIDSVEVVNQEIVVISEVVVNKEFDREIIHVADREYITMGIPAFREEYLEIIEPQLLDSLELSRLDNSNGSVEFSAVAYPNPATESTTISIDMPMDAERVDVRFMDMNGRILENVYEGAMERGTHEYQISLTDLKPAIYLVDIRYGNTHEVVRVVKAQ